LIECYLQIEQERFEERLRTTIDIPSHLENATIPALIVQPLIENAIKHGIARSRSGGIVAINACVDIAGPLAVLRITVSNTGPVSSACDAGDDGGVGLSNVRRRLECYYGADASLTLTRGLSGVTIAELSLPAVGLDAAVTPVPIEESLG
jgi:two-component system, LytTR family, sensor kinase